MYMLIGIWTFEYRDFTFLRTRNHATYIEHFSCAHHFWTETKNFISNHNSLHTIHEYHTTYRVLQLQQLRRYCYMRMYISLNVVILNLPEFHVKDDTITILLVKHDHL